MTFDTRAHASDVDREVLLEFPTMAKRFAQFSLTVDGGEIRSGEVLGVLGANGIGKSTFAQLLAGVLEPDTGAMDTRVRISYKPQYLKGDTEATVEEVLRQTTTKFDTSYYQHEILEPLSLAQLLQAPINTLSGGELQRVAIAICLSRDADLYILDEPSAHLDVEQRVKISRMIRKHAEGRDASTLVIDHDIYVIDMISDRILVFEGEPGIRGKAAGPFDMAPGMNRFLEALGITFRRDKSGRPRINKPGSFLDREQVAAGEYYYTEISK